MSTVHNPKGHVIIGFTHRDPFWCRAAESQEFILSRRELGKGSSDLSCPLVALFDEIQWEMDMESLNQFRAEQVW